MARIVSDTIKVATMSASTNGNPDPLSSELSRPKNHRYREPSWARHLISSTPASEIDLPTLTSLAKEYHARVSSLSAVLVNTTFGAESIMSVPITTRFSPAYSRRLISRFSSQYASIPSSHVLDHFLTFTIDPSLFPSLPLARSHLMSCFHRFSSLLYRSFLRCSSCPYSSRCPRFSSSCRRARSRSHPIKFRPSHPKPVLIRTCEFQLAHTNQLHLHVLVSGLTFVSFRWLFSFFRGRVHVKKLNDYSRRSKRPPAHTVRDYLAKYIFKSMASPFDPNNVLAWALRLRRFSISGLLSLCKSPVTKTNCNTGWRFLRSHPMGAGYGRLSRSSWWASLPYLALYQRLFFPEVHRSHDILLSRPLWRVLCSSLDPVHPPVNYPIGINTSSHQ